MKLTMKSKNIKKKHPHKTSLSPNFEERIDREIKFVIIHYTGMKPLKKTLKNLMTLGQRLAVIG